MIKSSDILALLRASSDPVQMKISDGRVVNTIIKVPAEEMSENEFAKFVEQLQGRFKHGTLTVSYSSGADEKIIVQWEESIITGQRR